MVEIDEDMVWAYAVKKYVFENGCGKFEGVKDLESYVADLKREKYARS